MCTKSVRKKVKNVVDSAGDSLADLDDDARDLGTRVADNAKAGFGHAGDIIGSGVRAGQDIVDGGGEFLAGLDDLANSNYEGAQEHLGNAGTLIGGAVTPDAVEDAIDDAGDSLADLDPTKGFDVGGGGGTGETSVPEEELTIPAEAQTPSIADASRSQDVDANKRRRGRAGYLGTILTGPTGITGGNIGRTILGR